VRRLTLGAVAWLLMGALAGAATPDPQLVAPIQKFVDSFNKGDAAGAAATHSATDDLVIIDEVPPYVWHGAQAFQTWAADLEGDSKKNGIAKREVAQMTFVLKKGASGWLIHGWTWTGPKPKRVAAAAPPAKP